MNLAELITRYVGAVRRDPAAATSQGILSELDYAAKARFADSVEPRAVTVAEHRMGARVVLVRTSLASSVRVPLNFPQAVEVVSFSVTVRPTYDAGEAAVTVLPTVEDVDVLLDINNAEIRTSQSDSAAAGAGGQSVNLASLDNARGLFGMRLENAKPQLGLTFRWATAATSQPAPFKSALVSVTAHYNKLTGTPR